MDWRRGVAGLLLLACILYFRLFGIGYLFCFVQYLCHCPRVHLGVNNCRCATGQRRRSRVNIVGKAWCFRRYRIFIAVTEEHHLRVLVMKSQPTAIYWWKWVSFLICLFVSSVTWCYCVDAVFGSVRSLDGPLHFTDSRLWYWHVLILCAIWVIFYYYFLFLLFEMIKMDCVSLQFCVVWTERTFWAM